MKSMTRKEVATRTGVSIETVRFYERESIIDEPPRTEAGYRQYPEEVINRIRFVKRAQNLGFSLPEIKDLLTLRITPDATPKDIRIRAEHKIQDIENKIKNLKQMKKTLQSITEHCSGKGKMSDCPILEALDKD